MTNADQPMPLALDEARGLVGRAEAERPFRMESAQAAGLERLLAGLEVNAHVGERGAWIYIWQDGEALHVLLDFAIFNRVALPGEWVSLDRAGKEIRRTPATHAELRTLSLRNDWAWRGMRRLLQERGVDPDCTVLVWSRDIDEITDMGILVTPDGQAIEWIRGLPYVHTGETAPGVKPDAERLEGWERLVLSDRERLARLLIDPSDRDRLAEALAEGLRLAREGFARLRLSGVSA